MEFGAKEDSKCFTRAVFVCFLLFKLTDRLRIFHCTVFGVLRNGGTMDDSIKFLL